jgi:hypothetical protein
MNASWSVAIFARIWLGLAALLVLLATPPWSLAQSPPTGRPPPAAASVRLPGHVLTQLGEFRELSPSELAQAAQVALAEKPLYLMITLNRADPAGLDAYAAGVASGRNPPLTIAELAARFGPSPDAYQAVINYLEGAGFTLVEGSRSRLSVTMQGTRGRAEKAFALRIKSFRAGDRTFFANEADPAVPANIAPLIQSISGLNSLAIAGPLASPNPGLPQSVMTAYGSAGVPPGITGSGQIVAIYSSSSYSRDDVALWLATAGLPAATLKQLDSVRLAGSSDFLNDSEPPLDIAAVFGVAPGAHIITVLGERSSSLAVALSVLWPQAAGDSGTGGIVSVSYHWCEREISNSDADALQNYARSMTASGTSLFGSTGDNANTCIAKHDGDTVRYPNRIPYPAGLPDAVAVGGTTLQVNAGNSFASESWWTDGGDVGGGFGLSLHFPRPAYQTPLTNAPGKSVPDVSAYANPGILVCQGWMCSGCPSGNCTRGTSLAAPLWAGIWALACDARAQGGGGQCPAAQGGYLYSLSPSAFRPPSSMTGAGNDFAHLGLGSPNVAAVIAAVAGRPIVTGISPASGPVIGGKTVTISGSNLIGVTSVLFENAGAVAPLPLNPFGQLTAISPALSDFTLGGPKHVTVTTAAGASDPNDAVFTYKPLVVGVSPKSGPIEGHQGVTLTGFGLTPQIAFGGVDALPGSRCDSDRQCVAPSPPGQPGTVHVTSGGSDPNDDKDTFAYETPTISRVEPRIGPEEGKIYVHVYGSGFATGIGVDPSVMSMEFCPPTGSCTPSPLAECSDTQSCTVFVPAGKGTVDIVARAGNGVSSTRGPDDQFSYVPFPTISGLTPVTGPATGSTQVSITGTNFAVGRGATRFNFGDGGSADGDCDTPTHCTVSSPAGTGGVYLTATVGGATGFGNTGANFAYIPVVKAIDPKSGHAIGGDTVTVTGAGFIDRDAFGTVHPGWVTFGASAATGLCSDPSRCTVTSPAGSGTVDVSVTAGEETSTPNAPADQFTYGAAGVTKGWTRWNFNPLPGPVDTLAYDATRKVVVGLGAWVVDTSTNNCPPPEDLPPGKHCVPPPPKFVQMSQTVTWNIDGAGWKQLSPSNQPHPGALDRAMAFHAASGKVVLFGGQFLPGPGPGGQPSNATWLWDGTTWTDATPPAAPPARFRASMTYDPVRQVVVLFGGCATAGCATRLNDTWTWDGRTWQQQSPAQSPPARNSASFAFLSPAGKAILFGGAGDASGFLGDTWEWDGSNWAQRSTAISPSPRRDAPKVETPAGLILFAGSIPGLPPADTWLFAAETWEQLHPATSPGASGPMAFDTDKQGAACVCSNNETWTWGGE